MSSQTQSCQDRYTYLIFTSVSDHKYSYNVDLEADSIDIYSDAVSPLTEGIV